MGKANLIYSIFRRQALSEVVDIFRDLPSSWGSDMNLVYGFLCRSDLVVDDRLVLRKRVPAEVVDPSPDPSKHFYPPEVRAIYFHNYRRAAAGSGFALLTAAVLTVRSAYDYWFSGRARRDYEDWRRRTLARFWVLGRIRRAFQARFRAGKE